MGLTILIPRNFGHKCFFVLPTFIFSQFNYISPFLLLDITFMFMMIFRDSHLPPLRLEESDLVDLTTSPLFYTPQGTLPKNKHERNISSNKGR